MKSSYLWLCLLALLLVGCSASQEAEVRSPDAVAQETQTEEVKPLSIVTSFYPLAFITENLVGEEVQVINLAGSKGVHDYELSPRDMVRIMESNLLIVQGAYLEPWAEDILENLESEGKVTLEVAEHLTLAPIEDKHHEEEDDHDDHHDEDHDDDHEDHDDHEDEHAGHDHGDFDPHTWLDPVLARDMVREIAEALKSIDPANTSMYDTKADELKARFAALDANYKAKLGSCGYGDVIVSHDAYGYLSRRYGFNMHAIAGLSTQDEPSAKLLAQLKEEAAEGITHILVEENNIRRFADTLARETGLETLAINPLGRGTLDPSKDFFDIMEANLESLSVALNCL